MCVCDCLFGGFNREGLKENFHRKDDELLNNLSLSFMSEYS